MNNITFRDYAGLKCLGIWLTGVFFVNIYILTSFNIYLAACIIGLPVQIVLSIFYRKIRFKDLTLDSNLQDYFKAIGTHPLMIIFWPFPFFAIIVAVTCYREVRKKRKQEKSNKFEVAIKLN